jgi:hypothetical protein
VMIAIPRPPHVGFEPDNTRHATDRQEKAPPR